MESRPCGECTLCCRLIGINECNEGRETDFPFYKPADTNCKHCLPGRGCEIVGTAHFPSLCKGYSCLWKDPRFLPEAYRPDKIGAICSVEGGDRAVLAGKIVIRAIVDRNVGVSPLFSRWVDSCVAMGVAFVVQSGERVAMIAGGRTAKDC
jgi:hypothetical protein